MPSRLIACGALALLMATPVSAQQARPSRTAVDTVASVDETVDAHGNRATGAMFDAVMSTDLGGGFEAVVRPFAQHLGTTGEWNRQIWLATLRYERQAPIGVRIDGGLIPSPVGYGNLMLRPHQNPTIGLPVSLFLPLPSADVGGPRATLLGVLYPYGVSATASGGWWDLRAAIIDTSPLRSRRVFAQTNPPRFANTVIGGGIAPLVGLRLGASLTHGGWQKGGEVEGNAANRDATVVTVESEYAAAYTRIGGEWTHDVMDTSHGRASASGWFVQGQQILTPRWFAAARVERIAAPRFNRTTAGFDRLAYQGTEEVVGFRVTPDVTLRAGHRARKAFGGTGYTHAATMSLVWWKRWL